MIGLYLGVFIGFHLELREITIYKDDLYNGEMKRDFIYIKDAIKMTYFL